MGSSSRGGAPRLDPGSRARHPGQRALEVRRARRRDQERIHRGLDRPHGQRQLQPADAERRHPVAHRRGAARLLPLLAASRPAVQPGLHRAGARQQSRHRARRSRTCSSPASIPRSPTRRARAPSRGWISASARSSRRSRAPTRTGSCARSGALCRRPCAPTPISSRRRATSRITCPSSSRARNCASCRCRSRCSRCSCSRPAWRACICAWASWRAAAFAGPTGARTSAPRSSA